MIINTYIFSTYEIGVSNINSITLEDIVTCLPFCYFGSNNYKSYTTYNSYIYSCYVEKSSTEYVLHCADLILLLSIYNSYIYLPHLLLLLSIYNVSIFLLRRKSSTEYVLHSAYLNETSCWM